jgi:hypothetical protein
MRDKKFFTTSTKKYIKYSLINWNNLKINELIEDIKKN